MKYQLNIKDTDPRHDHMVDAYAYMVAAAEAEAVNEYILPYIKNRPWYIPKFVYQWLISKLFVIAKFKKN